MKRGLRDESRIEDEFDDSSPDEEQERDTPQPIAKKQSIRDQLFKKAKPREEPEWRQGRGKEVRQPLKRELDEVEENDTSSFGPSVDSSLNSIDREPPRKESGNDPQKSTVANNKTKASSP